MVKVYRKYVRLADDVWGNENMDKAATEFAENHRLERPLIVHVQEHAGWFLSYLFGAPGVREGAICGTANDAAMLDSKVREFGKHISEIVDMPGELTWAPWCRLPTS